MADLSVTNSFSPNTVAASGEVNTNFTDVETWLNNRNAGTDTWGYVKVAATVANPVDITSTAATTEVSISNSATDGDPVLSFELSGTSKFTLGVDDGDSDTFKIGTTAIGTSTSVKIAGTEVTFPGTTITTGIATFSSAIRCAAGAVGAPSISFTGDTDSGFYSSSGHLFITSSGANAVQFASGGSITFMYNGTAALAVASATEVRAGSDNTTTCGTAAVRWSDMRSVLINGSDYGFANGWILREYPATFDDAQTKSDAWMEENANQGIQVINEIGETVMVFGRDGTLYAKQVKPLTDLVDLPALEVKEKKRKKDRKDGN